MPLAQRLDRYIVGQLIPPLMVGIVLFAVIMLGDTLYRQVQIVLEKRIPVRDVAAFLLYKLPLVFEYAVPVAAALAGALTASRLNQDSEFAAIRAAGISTARLVLPAFAFSVVLSLGTFAVGEALVPWANRVSEEALRRMALRRPELLPQPGSFIKAGSEWYFYVGGRGPEGLQNVLIFRQQPGQLPILITADSAQYRNQVWRLVAPQADKFQRHGGVIVSRTEGMMVDLGEVAQAFWSGQRGPEEMTLKELRASIARLRRANVNTYALDFEVHSKFAFPAACVIFVLFTFGAGLNLRGAPGFTGTTITIAAVFLFYLLYLACAEMNQRRFLPPAFLAWLPGMLYSAVALALLYRKR
jgi:lipopolysaccharide export system permease protein